MAKINLDEKQCYLILDVPPNISLDELKKSYHKLANIHHPDKPGGNEEKFKQINLAYDFLREVIEKKQNINQFKAKANDFKSNPKPQNAAPQNQAPNHKNAWNAWREKYSPIRHPQPEPNKPPTNHQSPSQEQTVHHQAPPSQKPEDIEELEAELEPSLAEKIFQAQQHISQKFTQFKNKSQAYLDQFTKGFYEKGKDEFLKLNIDIQTLLNGATKKIAIQRWIVCPQCQGNRQKDCVICGNQGRIKNREELEVQIPPSMEQGEKIKIQGKGGEGINGKPNGDLYLIAQIEGLEKYERKGLDLELQVGIPKKILLAGGDVMIKLLRGEFKLKIPPNSFDKRKLRIQNQGLFNQEQNKTGDLMIVLREVPDRT